MKKENELGIMIKCRKLIEYIFTVTEKSPKKFRFTITSKLQNEALSVMENLIRANEIFIKDKSQVEKYKKRLNYQEEAMINMKVLSYMAMIAREQECILPKQYVRRTKALILQ
ncbi:MAG: four helix bundle protein [Roseburia sp.]|nr:four helix bundle protein [Roseburia sp.]MCM1279059.1 four helix bundle protein [Robinsoniella sp.]